MKIKDFLSLIRVKQYIKNLFIFLPAFFAFKIFDLDIIINNGIAFISLCFISSSVYVLNDILDYESDRKHYKKKNRPIASGKISKKEGYIIMSVLLVIGITISILFSNIQTLFLLLSYIVINLLYVLWIKHIGIIDVFFIAIGYVIRVLLGGASGNIETTYWIIIMTFMLALFLGFAKRRDDVVIMKETGSMVRKSIDGYTLKFVDSVLFISSSITLVAYLMYTISPQTVERFNSNYIYITFFFVLLGILRYLQITIALQESGSPTEILYKDRLLQLSILGWILSFTLLVYL